MWRYSAMLMAVAMTAVVLSGEARQFSDVRAVVDLQRAADSYAFLHRRVERSLAVVTPEALAAAIQAARPAGQQRLFTPAVALAIRQAVTRVVRGGCDAGGLDQPQSTAAEYGSAAETRSLAPCVAAALPSLPEEIEFRSAGGALVIVDSQAALVIDVLEAPVVQTTTVR